MDWVDLKGNNYEWRPDSVDTILLALKQGIKTETEAISECGDFAKDQMLNWDYLRSKNETLFRKVMDWCEKHPPEL